jgi:hypothetical protein
VDRVRDIGLRAVALPPWLIDGWLVVGRAGDVDFLCHLVMARLAHAIRFRCEVVALTRLVTVRLAWALTLHCLGSYGHGQRTKKPDPVGDPERRILPCRPPNLFAHGLLWGRWREIERLAS